MGLASSWTDPGAGSAADAGARVGHRHDFAFEFLIVIVTGAGNVDKGAVLR